MDGVRGVIRGSGLYATDTLERAVGQLLERATRRVPRSATCGALRRALVSTSPTAPGRRRRYAVLLGK